MHLGVAFWKCKYTGDRHPNRKPLTGYFISNHLQIQALQSQVKPLRLHQAKQTHLGLANTRSGGERETCQKDLQKNGQNTSRFGAIWMFTCWMFYQFSYPPPPSRCYLCSRYWALHGGCVELIRTVIDGRVDDLSLRLNTRLDICLLAAFACFPPVYGNLSQYSQISF